MRRPPAMRGAKSKPRALRGRPPCQPHAPDWDSTEKASPNGDARRGSVTEILLVLDARPVLLELELRRVVGVVAPDAGGGVDLSAEGLHLDVLRVLGSGAVARLAVH